MTLGDLVQPFVEFAFMRRALAGAAILAIAAAPIGVFLTLRRMSLMGDAMAHGILPGLAAGFLLAGLSTPVMMAGGLAAGLLVALLSAAIARVTVQREDASLAALYLVALASGVLLLSTAQDRIDVGHVLFGSALGMDSEALMAIAAAAILSFVVLAVIWPALVLDTVDSAFLRALGPMGAVAHAAFLVVVVVMLVAGFQAVGTLMAVGLMILPAAAARFWTERLWPMILIAMAIGLASAVLGLLGSYAVGGPSGPAMIVAAGAIYGVSVFLGRSEGLITRLRPRAHLAG